MHNYPKDKNSEKLKHLFDSQDFVGDISLYADYDNFRFYSDLCSILTKEISTEDKSVLRLVMDFINFKNKFHLFLPI